MLPSPTKKVTEDESQASPSSEENTDPETKVSGKEKEKERASTTAPHISQVLGDVPRHRQISSNQALMGGKPANQKPMALLEYLFTRGFLEGACSDISFRAFGKVYHLHRLILERSPYFQVMFSSNWNSDEDKDKLFEVKLDGDENITQEAFELALGRLYGSEQELKSDDLYGLLAVANFLDLPDLSDYCVAQLIKNICSENISDMVLFCAKYNYGRATSKVMEGCKSYLCSEGLKMSFEDLDKIQESVLAEVIASDGFFVPTEWDRCYFILDLYSKKANRMKSENEDGDYTEENLEKLEVVKEALNIGVHFCHLSTERLFELERYRDVDGKALVKKETLRDGLWLQQEFRQKVSATSTESLGLTVKEWDQDEDSTYFPVPPDDKTQGSRGGGGGGGGGGDGDDGDGGHLWTRFPPFRFSAQFFGIKSMNDGERRYSDTFWACGSYWCFYIQKGKNAKSPQLGIYLHRGKIDSNGNLIPDHPPRHASSMHNGNSGSSDEDNEDEDDETMRIGSMTLNDNNTNYNHIFGSPQRNTNRQANTFLGQASQVNGLFGGFGGQPVQQQGNGGLFGGVGNGSDYPRRSSSSSMFESSPSLFSSTPRKSGSTTISTCTYRPYIDTRPKISAFFEIYTPSKRGNKHSLTSWSSAPDTFDFGQSWGWKSASLANVDEGVSLKFMVTIGVI